MQETEDMINYLNCWREALGCRERYDALQREASKIFDSLTQKEKIYVINRSLEIKEEIHAKN
jgi:hypothetical protein